MNLSNKTTKLFIHRDLLASANGREKLQDFLHENQNLLNHTIIKGITSDGMLDTVEPTLAQQSCSLSETSFQHFVAQKAVDDYVYASYESFVRLVGHPSI